jgi:8-oxo-dGTP pyrophosphatase MutT (NUDIX family)
MNCISTALFYDSDLNILVQKRGTHSKSGEIYGFWGGKIEPGENPEQALRRELIEELNYHPKSLTYWGSYQLHPDLAGELFLSPITPELLNSTPEVGTEIVVMSIDRAIKNENYEFGQIDTQFLLRVKSDISQKLTK